MEDVNGGLFYQKYLYLPLSKKAKKLISIMNKEWEILDRKALGTIRLCLEASMAFNISKEMTTKGLMMTFAKL